MWHCDCPGRWHSIVSIWKDSCFVFWTQKNCIFTTAQISVYNCTKFFTTAQSVHNFTLKKPWKQCTSVGIAEHFPWPLGWAQREYPKKTVFPEIRPLNGNFWNVKPFRDTACIWTRVRGKFGGNWSKESGRSGGVRRTHYKNRLCNPFFRTLSKTHSTISLKTCKALSFQASTPPAKFHPNPSKFPITKNDLPDRDRRQ